MKICYLSGVNSPHTKKWCEFFLEKNHEVHLISFDKGSIPGVTVHHIDLNITVNSNRIKKIKYLFSYPKVKKILSEIRPDLVHAHRATGYAFVAAMSKYHPYVLSVWGSDVYEFTDNPIAKKLVQFNLKNADYIFSTSYSMKSQVKKLVNRDVIVTPFGVDIEFFKPKQHNKETNKLVIGTIKTLDEKYGIKYLIKAFKIVLEKSIDQDIELIIAGKGNQKDELKNLCHKLGIEDKVNFLGYINQEDVVNTFNKFDIAIFPSILDSESFGVAAVEAQACGVPVIVSNVGGLPEATKPNFSSILVEKEDEKLLADAILTLIKNKDLRLKMSKNAREFVENKYNINDNFGDVESFYKKITNKS